MKVEASISFQAIVTSTRSRTAVERERVLYDAALGKYARLGSMVDRRRMVTSTACLSARG